MKMTKPLKRIENKCWYFADGKKIDGVHSGIRGNPTGIWGDVTYISGSVTGIRGDVSGISGDFDEIPMADRKEKPNVSDWVE